MIMPATANANEQFAATRQARNHFGIVVGGVGPHAPLDLGSAGGPGIVRGRAQHRHGQNQPNLQQTERHRVRSSLLAKCQEYKNERPLTEPELYRDYPDRLHVHEILFEAEWHGCRRAPEPSEWMTRPSEGPPDHWFCCSRVFLAITAPYHRSHSLAMCCSASACADISARRCALLRTGGVGLGDATHLCDRF
jgi:hypothetical protein